MEKTTFINGNGQPYERTVPMVAVHGIKNDSAREWLRTQTGIRFEQKHDGSMVGQPETWEQFARVILTYNGLTHDVNNWMGNILHIRIDCNTPANATLRYRMNGTEYVGVEGVD